MEYTRGVVNFPLLSKTFSSYQKRRSLQGELSRPYIYQLRSLNNVPASLSVSTLNAFHFSSPNQLSISFSQTQLQELPNIVKV
jgi:hypothetical protein